MKISDYRDGYYLFTGKASDIVRQLALAGIAVVWILKGTGNETKPLPVDLLIPSIGFLASLAFDLGQYVVASIIWKQYYRELETRNIPDNGEDREEYDFGFHDVKKERPVAILFWIKIGVAALSWTFLMGVLVRRLVP